MTLTTQDDYIKQVNEVATLQATCRKLLETPHYRKLGEEGIHVIMARAKALGIHPFEALNGGFHCIQGKVGMSTEMMAALIRQRGHSITKDPKSTPECVILKGKRKDNGDEWICSFSKDDAIAAGLWGSATWKKYPQIMLYNRCMSMLFRQLFPDLSLGAGYVEDELKEITKTGDYAEKSVAPESLPEAEVVIEEKKLSVEQVNKLNEALAKCPQRYQDNILAALARLERPIIDLAYLELHQYEKLLAAAIKNQIKEESVNSNVINSEASNEKS
jgi:hypothetical protein